MAKRRKYQRRREKKLHLKKLLLLIPGLILVSILPLFLYHSFDSRRGASSTTFSTITNTANQLQSSGKVLVLPSEGKYTSQYSPYVLSISGWTSELIYYCKNTQINGVYRDRVWRAEFKNGQVVDNRVVIDGTLNTNHDKVCSPGVVIAPDGTWHMYFVSSDRRFTGGKHYIHHATAQAPGVNWQIVGVVQGNFGFPRYLELPSPILTSSGVDLYYISNGNILFKASSTDFHNFTNIVTVNAPQYSVGRVVRNHLDNKLYYSYGLPESAYVPPHEIRLAYSPDGKKFVDTGFLLKNSSNSSEWDHVLAQTPFPVFYNNSMRIYYSGTKLPGGKHFTADSGIGYRTFNYKAQTSSPTPTPSSEYHISLHPEVFWSDPWGDSVIAVKSEKKQSLLNHGWKKTGSLRWMADRKIQGTAAVYELWSDYVKDHFYTTNVSERNSFVNQGWVNKGVIGYLYTQPASGRRAIYRGVCGPWTDPKAHYFLYSFTNSFPGNCRPYGILGYTK